MSKGNIFYLPTGTQGGKGVRVVDCILALKSFSESKTTGRQTPCKYGSITKPLTSGKHFILKNSDAFLNKLMRSHTTEPIQKVLIAEQSIETDCCLESTEMVSLIMEYQFLFHTQSCDVLHSDMYLFLCRLLQNPLTCLCVHYSWIRNQKKSHWLAYFP